MSDPVVEAVVGMAEAQLGKRYVMGTEGPSTFDCSGLVYWSFTQTGYGSLIGGARKRAAGYTRWFTDRGKLASSLSAAKRGDLLVYSHDAGGRVSHIAIYTGERPNAMSAENPSLGVRRHTANGVGLHFVGVLLVDYPSYGDRKGGASNPSQPGDPEVPPGGGDPSPPNPTHTLRRTHRAALRAEPRTGSPVVAWAESGSEIGSADGLSGEQYEIRAGGIGYQSRAWLIVDSLDGLRLPAPAYTAALLWVPIPAEPPAAPDPSA